MFFDSRVRFAEADDDEAIQELLWTYGMWPSGGPGEQILLSIEGKIAATAHLQSCGEARFYLSVIGVREDLLSSGLGGVLLREVLTNPWQASRRESEAPAAGSRPFVLTTIARGESRGFYAHYGFEPCDFSEIPEEHREQCDICLESETCDSQPMILRH
jgi:N-acetylglutamate synthase-like GNAT family acetyltransferase